MVTDEQLQNEFMELVTRCRGSIIRLCLIYTDRQPDNVNDLFQDIVYNLWRAFPNLRRRDSAHNWVYSVAIRVARMHHRSRRNKPRYVDLDYATLASLIDDGEDEMLAILYSLIDRLDNDDKTLLFLYIDRVPQKEIAAIYHTSEMSVNHKINRLKKKLKKMHEDER